MEEVLKKEKKGLEFLQEESRRRINHQSINQTYIMWEWVEVGGTGKREKWVTIEKIGKFFFVLNLTLPDLILHYVYQYQYHTVLIDDWSITPLISIWFFDFLFHFSLLYCILLLDTNRVTSTCTIPKSLCLPFHDIIHHYLMVDHRYLYISTKHYK